MQVVGLVGMSSENVGGNSEDGLPQSEPWLGMPSASGS